MTEETLQACSLRQHCNRAEGKSALQTWDLKEILEFHYQLHFLRENKFTGTFLRVIWTDLALYFNTINNWVSFSSTCSKQHAPLIFLHLHLYVFRNKNTHDKAQHTPILLQSATIVKIRSSDPFWTLKQNPMIQFHLFWAVSISLWGWGPLYTTLDKPCCDKAPSVRAMEPMLEG